MVMFKAKFRPMGDKPRASSGDSERPRSAANDKPRVQRKLQQQQQQQQQQQPQPERKAPPIEEERGPQYPVEEPDPAGPGERA